ncbi:hypothetical protein CERSUDRAFT_115984 [Gelatoporia subvermispora B]|uniref:Protein LCHN n=1 Tax=Ceriporiopsis subvermispora (strain B) TaxID=914234 RepID=M2QGA4_CERS8|nr:hypothetical protein CERSUDRAFT_115984 [Gelatoporia subvermispora B]
MQSPDSSGSVPQDVVAIFHASFHPTQGNVVDWSLKSDDDLDLTHVEYSCLPSGLHLIERDVVYFTKDEHAGVCIFHRRRTTEHGHRGFRLSSLGILLAKSSRPRPWRHVAALKELISVIYALLSDRDALEPTESDWDPARAFFEERRVQELNLGGAGDWSGWSAELDNDEHASSPTVHLPHLLRILGPSSLTLYKHVLGRRRILIYTLPPVEAACVLCQVAADVCWEAQRGELDTEGSDEDEDAPRVKSKSTEGTRVLGMVTLNDLDRLESESKKGRGWIACTTDALFLEKPAHYDLLIDLRTATPNTRPTFYVAKPLEQPGLRGASHRLSVVRFTWSDVKLWTELDRLLQLDASDHPHHDACCDPSHGNHKRMRGSSSTWTDVWRVYEDVCIMCAGLWMGSWRGSSPLVYSSAGRLENWGSVRLEGEDDFTPPRGARAYVRSLGMGIEGRPAPDTMPGPGRPLRSTRRSSAASAWTWAGVSSAAAQREQAAKGEPEEDDLEFITDGGAGSRALEAARRERQVLTTLALLQTFHAHTAGVLDRLGGLLPARRLQSRFSSSGRGEDSDRTVVLTPRDVMSFELGPFSGLDARFVEWIGEEYGDGAKIIVRRGWRDLVGLVFGFG